MLYVKKNFIILKIIIVHNSRISIKHKNFGHKFEKIQGNNF